MVEVGWTPGPPVDLLLLLDTCWAGWQSLLHAFFLFRGCVGRRVRALGQSGGDVAATRWCWVVFFLSRVLALSWVPFDGPRCHWCFSLRV